MTLEKVCLDLFFHLILLKKMQSVWFASVCVTFAFPEGKHREPPASVDGVRGGDGHTRGFGGDPHCLSVPPLGGLGLCFTRKGKLRTLGKQTHTKFIPTFISMQAFGKDHLYVLKFLCRFLPVKIITSNKQPSLCKEIVSGWHCCVMLLICYLMLLKTCSCAQYAGRSNKPKCWSSEQRNVYCRTKQREWVACAQKIPGTPLRISTKCF